MRRVDRHGYHVLHRDSFVRDLYTIGFGSNPKDCYDLWDELDDDGNGVLTILELSIINDLPPKDDMYGNVLDRPEILRPPYLPKGDASPDNATAENRRGSYVFGRSAHQEWEEAHKVETPRTPGTTFREIIHRNYLNSKAVFRAQYPFSNL